MTMMLRVAVTLLIACLAGFMPRAVALPTDEPVPGGVAVLEVPMKTTSASFDGHRVMLVDDAGKRYAIIGIPLSTQPGRHSFKAGSATSYFTVKPKAYETQRLTITNKRQVNPLPEDLARIKRESAEIDAALAHFDKSLEVHTTFTTPADGPVSSPFGMRRILNGEPRSPHSGIDIAAPLGADIRAAASGKVVATGDYFFDGKTVIVDHGQGLVTIYCHMSQFAVKTGDMVQAGQKLGEVGQTGRVTGPNLHWGVSLNDARVDPELFLK